MRRVSGFQRSDDRRVVGGALALAHLAVDQGSRAASGERRGEQEMVDAQAKILLEAEHAVIPPGETFFGLVEQAEAVLQSAGEQRAEGGALGVRAEYLAGPGDGVVHVAVIRCDVEVAGDRQLRVRCDFLAQPAGERVQPGELVGVFFAADFLTVRHVGADDADAVDRRRNQALLRVGEMRIADGDIGQRPTREQGDAEPY